MYTARKLVKYQIIQNLKNIRYYSMSTDNNKYCNKRMAVYWHPLCSKHLIPNHPEQPARVDAILAHLRSEFIDNEISYRESKAVKDEVILHFHTKNHLDYIKQLHQRVTSPNDDQLESSDSNNKKSKKKNKKQNNNSSKRNYASIDEDTTVMPHTLDAAYHAAGAVINALDHIYAPEYDGNKIDTAFCCVRPPGHHAERNKACGFCFFNNVAIGARYAQQKYRVGKVAVLDFDVHHGNGTEEGFQEDETLFYGSTHGKGHFPGSGHDPSPHIGEAAKNELHRRIVDREIDIGPQSKSSFRKKWKEVLLEMERFEPELVIISAGFDAHLSDPLASCELDESDFKWATEQILESTSRITRQKATGSIPCISVLEGGYNVGVLTKSAAVHVKALLADHDSPILRTEDPIEPTQDIISDVTKAIAAVNISDNKNSKISVDASENSTLVASTATVEANESLLQEEEGKLDVAIAYHNGDEAAALDDYIKAVL